MTTPDSRGDARRPGSFDEIRGYLAAAGDLSSIARARILDAARSAARTEVERAGGALGLAGAEETARLRRTVERLERRVAALEGSGGPGGRSSSRPASRGAGRRPPLPRPTAAGTAAAANGAADDRAVTPEAPAAGAPSPGAPSSSDPTPDASAAPTRSASGARPPVRRPTPPAPTTPRSSASGSAPGGPAAGGPGAPSADADASSDGDG